MAIRDVFVNQEMGFAPEVEFTGEIHPVADLFPMMTDDELDDLAADIKANGQKIPAVLDCWGRLVDGRQRVTACGRAGVQAIFHTLSEEDSTEENIREFIGSVNEGKRRRATQGQTAAGYTEMYGYWDGDQYKLYKGQEYVARKAGVPRPRIAECVIVMQYTPAAFPGVKSGAIPLSVAVQDARDEKDRRETDEYKFARLQEKHPDLAVMVQEKTLPLNEAMAAADARKAEEEKKEAERQKYINLRTQQLDAALIFLDPSAMNPDEWAQSCLEINPEIIGATADFSAVRARRAADALLRYAALKEVQENGKE